MGLDIRETILNMDLYYQHNWSDIYKAIHDKDDTVIEPDDGVIMIIEAEKYRILHNGYKVCCIIDPEYPKEILHNVFKPPYIIYYKGDLKTVLKRFQEIKYNPEEGCFID